MYQKLRVKPSENCKTYNHCESFRDQQRKYCKGRRFVTWEIVPKVSRAGRNLQLKSSESQEEQYTLTQKEILNRLGFLTKEP